MARWTPVPIAGGAYSDDTRPWAHQDCVNYIPTPAERPGARSDMKLTSAPGFTTFCATMQEAPVRALHNVEGLLLAVTGDTLYRIGVDGVATSIGTIPGVRRCSIAHNQITGGHEVLVANGQSGYVYNTADGTFGQVTDDGFPGMKVADFVDGYIAGIEPAGRYWLHSNLRAATDYNTLDRYDSESSPDKMVSLIVSHREVMVLNQRSSAFYRNVGGSTGTFQNSNGTELEVGCASTHAVARLDNTVFWLGNDGIVYRLAGHAPQRVSTGPIEQAISRCNTANAFAFTFEDHGHKIFYLTFPDGATWGYDVWTNEWHRRQSKDLPRWRLSDLVQWNGAWIGGDYSNGRLYQLDWAVQHEAGEEMEKRRITPVLHDNQNRITLNAVELVVDTGMGDQSPPFPSSVIKPLAIYGDVPDGWIGEPMDPYSYTIDGGVLPHGDKTISAGSLPPGLSMSAAGVVTGTPTALGSYSWTVSVTDIAGTTATVDDSALVDELAWFTTASDGTTETGLRSFDGLDWSGATDENLGGRGLFSGNGAVVAINSAGGKVSFDKGLTWQPITGTSSTTLTGGDYVNGRFFIRSTASGDSRWSDDGIAYTTFSLPSNLNVINGFAGVGNRVVAVGSASIGGNCAVSDDSGETWTGLFQTFSTNTAARAIASSGTKLVAAGDQNLIGVSDDGDTWTPVTSPFAGTTSIRCVSFGAGVWVAANATGEIAFSSDGESWSLADDTLGQSANAIDFGAGRFILVGQNKAMKYSLDGNTWVPIANSYNAIANIKGIAAFRPAE